MYIATHIKGNERQWCEFRGFMATIALLSLMISIVCAIAGI
jgi:hypothetical protein